MLHLTENQNYLYLILPMMLVGTQVFSQKYNTPETKEENWIVKVVEFLPVLSGLTALSSPAGLGVYWYTNTVLSFAQSLYVKAKLKDEGLDMNQIALDNQKPLSQEGMLKEERRVNDEMKKLLEKAKEIERKKKGIAKIEDGKEPINKEDAVRNDTQGEIKFVEPQKEKIMIKNAETGLMEYIEVPKQEKKNSIKQQRPSKSKKKKGGSRN